MELEKAGDDHLITDIIKQIERVREIVTANERNLQNERLLSTLPFKVPHNYTVAACALDYDTLHTCVGNAKEIYEGNLMPNGGREKYRNDLRDDLFGYTYRTEEKDGTIIDRWVDPLPYSSVSEGINLSLRKTGDPLHVRNEQYIATIMEGRVDHLEQGQLVYLLYLLRQVQTLDIVYKGLRVAGDMSATSDVAARHATEWLRGAMGKGQSIFSGISELEQGSVDDLEKRLIDSVRREEDPRWREILEVLATDGIDNARNSILTYDAAIAHIEPLTGDDIAEMFNGLWGNDKLGFMEMLRRLPFAVGEPFVDSLEYFDDRDKIVMELMEPISIVHNATLLEVDGDELTFQRNIGHYSHIINGEGFADRYPRTELFDEEENVRYDNENLLTDIVGGAIGQDDEEAFLEDWAGAISAYSLIDSTIRTITAASAMSSSSPKAARYARNWLVSVKGKGIFSGEPELHSIAIEELKKQAVNALKGETNPDFVKVLETLIADMGIIAGDFANFTGVSDKIWGVIDEMHAAEIVEEASEPVVDAVEIEQIESLIELPPTPPQDEEMEVENGEEDEREKETLIDDDFERVETESPDHYGERPKIAVDVQARLSQLAIDAGDILLPEGARPVAPAAEMKIEKPRSAQQVIGDDRAEWLAKRKSTANLAWLENWETLDQLADLFVDGTPGGVLYKSRLGAKKPPAPGEKPKRRRERKYPYHAFEFPYRDKYTAVICECAEPDNATYILVIETAQGDSWRQYFKMEKQEARDAGVTPLYHVRRGKNYVPHWERCLNEIERQADELEADA